MKELRILTKLPLVQLVDEKGSKPYDFVLSGDVRNSEDLLTIEGLQEMATYCNVVAPYKEYIVPRTIKNELGTATTLIENAHKCGLLIHTWTFRPENHFLPSNLQTDDETIAGDGSIIEIQTFLKAGLDGFFSDSSDYGRRAIDTLSE